MALTLVKTHAFGNDFLLVARGALAPAVEPAKLARHACDRHRGIGADGLMILEETPGGARAVLHNADGGIAEVSGNGIRCAAAWLAHQRNLGAGGTVVIDTGAGPRTLTLVEPGFPRSVFRADMGHPENPRMETLTVGETAVDAVVLRVGNPQCVVLGPATPERLETLAAQLATHPFFPAGTNVELAAVEDSRRVRILIWERGVGPTEASGTGACAAAVAAAAFGGAARDVEVVSPGGTQRVEWTSTGIWLTGWAEIVGAVEWWSVPGGGAGRNRPPA